MQLKHLLKHWLIPTGVWEILLKLRQRIAAGRIPLLSRLSRIEKLRSLARRILKSAPPPEVMLSASVADVFYSQFDNESGAFRRHDMIVRLLAAENVNGSNGFGLQLYAQMQRSRIQEDTKGRFEKLIASYKENGYDSNSRILCDKDFILQDGSHRLSLALHFKQRRIGVVEQLSQGMRPDYREPLEMLFQQVF